MTEETKIIESHLRTFGMLILEQGIVPGAIAHTAAAIEAELLDRPLTQTEAAQQLGMATSTFQRLREQQVIRGFDVPGLNTPRYSRRDLVRWRQHARPRH